MVAGGKFKDVATLNRFGDNGTTRGLHSRAVIYQIRRRRAAGAYATALASVCLRRLAGWEEGALE